MARPTVTREETSGDDDIRNSRETESREYEDLTDEDRVSLLRDEMINQALPTVPKIPGYHTIWLSTTNQYDTISRRVRLGYTPVKPEDLPQADFSAATIREGAYIGCIGTNEMLLFKIPEALYQKFMKLMHHDLPQEEEEKLKANIKKLQDGSLSNGHSLVREVGDGTDELLRQPSRKVRQFQ